MNQKEMKCETTTGPIAVVYSNQNGNVAIFDKLFPDEASAIRHCRREARKDGARKTSLSRRKSETSVLAWLSRVSDDPWATYRLVSLKTKKTAQCIVIA